MARIERNEIHLRALTEGVKLGTRRMAKDLGFRDTRQYVWEACPVCRTPRWVRTACRGRWCRHCSWRRANRYEAIVAAAPRSAARLRELCALGRAAESAGLTLARLREMAGENG